MQAEAALSKDKRPYMLQHRKLNPGTPVGLRIDIPAYLRCGQHVVTVHEQKRGGKVGKRIGYDIMASVLDAEAFCPEKAILSIRNGKAKSPVATVEGKIVHKYEIPKNLSNYEPCKFNPIKATFFYSLLSGAEVVSAAEAILICGTVFFRKPVFGPRCITN